MKSLPVRMLSGSFVRLPVFLLAFCLAAVSDPARAAMIEIQECKLYPDDPKYKEALECLWEQPLPLTLTFDKNVDLNKLAVQLLGLARKYTVMKDSKEAPSEKSIGTFQENLTVNPKNITLMILPSNEDNYREYIIKVLETMPTLPEPPVPPLATLTDEVYTVKYVDPRPIKKKLLELYLQENLGWDRVHEMFFISDATSEADRTFLVRAYAPHHELIKRLLALWDERAEEILVEATIVKVNLEKAGKLGTSFTGQRTEADPNNANARFKVLDIAGTLGSFTNFGSAVAYTFLSGKNESYGLTLRSLLTHAAAEVMLNANVVIRSGGNGEFKKVTTIPITTITQNGPNTTLRETGLTVSVSGRLIHEAVLRDEALQQLIATYGLHSFDRRTGEDEIPTIALKFSVTDGSAGATTVTTAMTYTPSDDMTVSSERYFTSGDVIVLGGVLSTERSRAHSRVPLLSDLPLLGKFFRSRETRRSKSEILVFMRASEVSPETSTYLASRFPDARQYIPIHLGGYLNDSVKSHPWTQGPLTSRIIYGTHANPEGLYFTFNGEVAASVGAVAPDGNSVVSQKSRFPPLQQRIIAQLFKERIRDRLKESLVSANALHQEDWINVDLIRNLVATDPGLKEAFAEIEALTGADPVHTLVFARHLGVLSDASYDLYLDVLYKRKVHTLGDYQALLRALAAPAPANRAARGGVREKRR